MLYLLLFFQFGLFGLDKSEVDLVLQEAKHGICSAQVVDLLHLVLEFLRRYRVDEVVQDTHDLVRRVPAHLVDLVLISQLFLHERCPVRLLFILAAVGSLRDVPVLELLRVFLVLEDIIANWTENLPYSLSVFLDTLAVFRQVLVVVGLQLLELGPLQAGNTVPFHIVNFLRIPNLLFLAFESVPEVGQLLIIRIVSDFVRLFGRIESLHAWSNAVTVEYLVEEAPAEPVDENHQG